LSWCVNPEVGHGIYFSGPGDSWDFWGYDRLARLTMDVAGGLTAAGLGDGDVVCLVQRSGPEFVAALFGSMLAGAAASPIAPPALFQDPAAYGEHLSGLLSTARPGLVVTEPDLLPRVEPVAAAAGVPSVTVGALLGLAAGPRAQQQTRRGADLALLQFTSGSSGRCRGVRVPFSALEANIAALRSWLRWTPDDPVASWLPVHHDMGLIGCLITPVVSRSDLWLLRPEEFIHRPDRYLRCFGESGARLTATPNFGLDYITRRVSPDSLRGCDFSQWRAVIVGAEHLSARSFERFYELLAPFGLPDHALRPAYGQAECTLAVTGLPLGERWTGAHADPASFRLGEAVLTASEPSGETGGWPALVGSGRPLDGLAVTIVDENGASLPEGLVGEVTVRGASVAAGYADHRPEPVSSFAGGVLHSGDAGFMLDGQLYILGRMGDSIKVRGRAVFAEDLEGALASLGVPAHRVAVAAGLRHHGTRLRPSVIALFEQPPGREVPAQARDVLRRRAEGAEIVLASGPAGTIPRTTSGKVQRHRIWRDFLAGNLPVLPENQEEQTISEEGKRE
jgi:acyl-CoA synthetase (AMP-forming)/AMP-acid ligase II